MRHGFGGNEKLLSLASALVDHLIDGVSQGNLVVIKPCSIDVSDANLESLFEKSYKGLLVLDLVGSHTDKWKDLLVGKKQSGNCLLLVFLLFLRHR